MKLSAASLSLFLGLGVRKAAADHTSLRQLWGDRTRYREPSDDSGDDSSDDSSDDNGKKVCLEYGFLDKVVLPAGPIPAADATCDPTPTNAAYDPQQCPVYIEPFFLEDSSDSSAQYEQVDGKDAICIVNPLSSTADDKFIMTYFGRLTPDRTDTTGLLFPDTPLSGFEKLSYDFYVKECQNQKTSCPEQFYTGLYARTSAVSQTPFYDCRFNYVPAAGGEEGTWTTFTFTADTPGRACGLSVPDCTSPCVTGWVAGGQYSLNDYIAATYGDAVISSVFAQAWNLNIGDSAANDEGLQGCYGDIRFTFAGKTDVLQFTPAQ